MTEAEIYRLLTDWMVHSYLADYPLEYDGEIYGQAVQQFREDYARWFPHDNEISRKHLQLTPQLHAVLTYRLAHLFWKSGREDQAQLLSLLGRVNGQIEIYYSSEIGTGFKINHGVGSVIGARCILGAGCTIHQNVTLGDRNGRRPIVGNRVVLYAGAMVLGDVTVGDDSIVGANAVVLSSFPAHAILTGTPAKNKER